MTNTSERTAPTGQRIRVRWLIVAVMLTAELMDLLDSTIVNAVGPSLERSLGTSSSGLQWVVGVTR